MAAVYLQLTLAVLISMRRRCRRRQKNVKQKKILKS